MKKIENKKQDVKSLNSFFIGLTFGAGRTPCIGPVLASVYALGAIYPDLYIRFFHSIYGIIFTRIVLRTAKETHEYTSKVNAIIFILMGILLVSGTIDQLSMDLTRWFGNQ